MSRSTLKYSTATLVHPSPVKILELSDDTIPAQSRQEWLENRIHQRLVQEAES